VQRQCRRVAADWHDGQFAHNAHAHFARRANQDPVEMKAIGDPTIRVAFVRDGIE
jgi:hypothetical protein